MKMLYQQVTTGTLTCGGRLLADIHVAMHGSVVEKWPRSLA